MANLFSDFINGLGMAAQGNFNPSPYAQPNYNYALANQNSAAIQQKANTTKPGSAAYTAPKSSYQAPTTSTTPTTNTGGGGWQSLPGYAGWDPAAAAADYAATGGAGKGGGNADPYAAIKNEISSGWDSYISQLGEQESGLNTQRTAQEDIFNNAYTNNVSAANTQKTKSLRDIYENVQNAFKAGNNMLGAAGAGDSSAVNQYSYALNKQSTRQISNLNEYVNTQINNFAMQRDNGIAQVANWFAEQQNALKRAQAEGQLNKSRDIATLSKSLLDQGIQMIQQQKTTYDNRYNALISWAGNNATTLPQLQANIAGIPQVMQGISPQVSSSGNYLPTGYGYGNSNEQNKNSLFQNPAWFS